MNEIKRLHRLEAGKKFAGVCAGLAEYFKLDPVIVRLVFVGLALLNGVGIVLYIVAWIVLPKKVA